MSEKLFGDANWGESFCDALKDRQPKPLRWRTGPVPVDELGFGVKVFYKLRDGWGYGIGAGEEEGGVFDGDWHIKKGDILCWLPLSEILDLIGE